MLAKFTLSKMITGNQESLFFLKATILVTMHSLFY